MTGSTNARPEWVSAVDVAVIDPFRGYAVGLTARHAATIVVDHFHAIRLANVAIDDARRRVQQQAKGILMAAHRCSPDEAWAMLRAVSNETNRKLHDVAADLVREIQQPSS